MERKKTLMEGGGVVCLPTAGVFLRWHVGWRSWKWREEVRGNGGNGLMFEFELVAQFHTPQFKLSSPAGPARNCHFYAKSIKHN
jgi:hypothetical protein